jgi:hypothetical protein
MDSRALHAPQFGFVVSAPSSFFATPSDDGPRPLDMSAVANGEHLEYLDDFNDEPTSDDEEARLYEVRDGYAPPDTSKHLEPETADLEDASTLASVAAAPKGGGDVPAGRPALPMPRSIQPTYSPPPQAPIRVSSHPLRWYVITAGPNMGVCSSTDYNSEIRPLAERFPGASSIRAVDETAARELHARHLTVIL